MAFNQGYHMDYHHPAQNHAAANAAAANANVSSLSPKNTLTRQLSHSPSNHSTSILSELQSLWVLFNPVYSNSVNRQSSTNDDDILSITNTSSQFTDIDSNQQQLDEEEEEQIDSLSEDEVEDEEEDDDDSLIDNFQSNNSTPSQSRLEQLFNDKSYNQESEHSNNLDNKINNWKQNNFEESIDESVVDDNIASWDLDENLINSNLDKSIIERKTKRSPPQFYGDSLFNSRNDYHKFRKISPNLSASLSQQRNNTNLVNSSLPDLINQLLVKYINQQNNNKNKNQDQNKNQNIANKDNLLNEQRQKYLLILQKSNSNSQLISNLIKNQFSNDEDITFNSSITSNNDSINNNGFNHNVEFSDSLSSSSLIPCGGIGFGGNSSWNDI